MSSPLSKAYAKMTSGNQDFDERWADRSAGCLKSVLLGNIWPVALLVIVNWKWTVWIIFLIIGEFLPLYIIEELHDQSKLGTVSKWRDNERPTLFTSYDKLQFTVLVIVNAGLHHWAAGL